MQSTLNFDSEEWAELEVKRNKTRYFVSNYGRIKSINTHSVNPPNKETILKQKINRGGYCYITIYGLKKKSYRIHRLVALSFIPNPLNKTSVNHKDGVKINNHVSNLEWVTTKENNEHAKIIGLLKPLKGEDTPRHKLFVKDIYNIRKVARVNKIAVYKQLALQYGITIENVRAICDFKSWKHLKNS
jgi:NUMOD4 motif/HNH endonuclease